MLKFRKPYDQDYYQVIQAEFNEPDANRTYTNLSITNLARFLGVLKTFNRTPTSLLDAGCRDGAIMEAAAQLQPGLRIEGIDIVQAHVDATRQRGLSACIGDLHNLPYADCSFDAVYCSQTLEHCHEPLKALGELLRVTRHAVFIGVPLEEATDFDQNLSHFTYSINPYDWLDLYRAYQDNWLPLEVYMNTTSPYLNTILLHFDYDALRGRP